MKSDISVVRSYTLAFDELENIKHAGFNFVVCVDECPYSWPLDYKAAFYYHAEADAYATMMIKKTGKDYAVYGVEELAFYLDEAACRITEDNEDD